METKTRAKHRSWLAGIFNLTAILALTSACGLFKQDGAELETDLALALLEASSAFEYFEVNVYPWTQTARCAQCHSGSVSPPFAHPDLNIAHNAALNLIDQADPTLSRIYERTLDGHSGCPSSECEEEGAKILILAAGWTDMIALENAGGGDDPEEGDRLTFDTLTIPGTTPIYDSGDPQGELLTWDLGSVFSGATMNLTVAQLDTDSYIVFDPELVTLNSVAVADVQFWINNTYNASYLTFDFIDQTVTPPGEILTTYAPLLPVIDGPGADTITLTIGTLESP